MQMSDSNVTLALFGDCATHMAGAKYKHTRAVGLTNWLSIVSPSTENFRRLTREKLDETSLNGYEKRICFLDSNKNFLEYLLEEKADYLILDCNDCRKQLIFDAEAPEGIHACITDNCYMPEFKKCVKTMFGTRGGNKYLPSTDIERAEYDKAIEIICSRIKQVYKPEQIILNKHYYAEGYIDETGFHRYIRDLFDENDKTLELIKYVESVVEKYLEGCHVINFPDNVLGASEHIFGICSLHYHSSYYDYVRESLEVIFQGLQEEKILLNLLRYNYSMQFKLMKMERLAEIRGKVMEKEIDNIVSLGNWTNSPVASEKNARFLQEQNDICEYLDVLYMLRDKITILLAVRDTSGCYSDSIVLKKLKKLGFRNFPARVWWMYAGIIFKGTTLIDCTSDEAEKPVEVVQQIGNSKIRLQSKAFHQGNQAVIEIDGKDYSQNRRGFNIVVCSACDGQVLDSVSYDSHVMDYFSRSKKNLEVE